MNENIFNLLEAYGISMITFGFGIWLKPLVVWSFLKPLRQLDPSLSQLMVFSLSKMLISTGVIALLIDFLFILFANGNNDKLTKNL